MKIMVCFDSSDRSIRLLKLASSYAKAFNADVDVVTVGSPEDKIKRIEALEKGLEKAKTLLEDKGLPCKTHLLIRGLSKGKELTDFAEENKIDLIIIGIKKTSPVGKFILGSTARYVILNASCPVLTTK